MLDQKYLDIANAAFDNMIKYLVKDGDVGLPVLAQTCGAESKLKSEKACQSLD